jgi:serine/threonine protein kinase
MSLVEIRVNGRYKLGHKLFNSSFGEIYSGKNVQSSQDVAIKLEPSKNRHSKILYESRILSNLQGGIGIPTLYWAGTEGDFNIMVMDNLGRNLESLLKISGGKFSLKTVLMLAEQLISNIEYIHYKNYLHRNIKPENFLLGSGRKSHRIYTIDFVMAKNYRDPKSLEHVTYSETKKIVGAPRYASLNALQGVEITRRDDLENLGYLLIYFLNGSLPWQGLSEATREDYIQKIKEMKTNLDFLTDLPIEFSTYFNYCRKLKFDEKPDYGYLKKIFKELFVRSGYEYDYVYDWLLVGYEKDEEDFWNIQNNEVNLESENNEFDEFENNQKKQDNFLNLIHDDEEKTIQQLMEICKKKFERPIKSLSCDSFKNEDFQDDIRKTEKDLNPTGKRLDNYGSLFPSNQKGQNLTDKSFDLGQNKKNISLNEKIGGGEKKGSVANNSFIYDKKGVKGNKKNGKDCSIF